MKSTARVVVAALASGANFLPAQDNSTPPVQSGATVIVNGAPVGNGVQPGGVQTFQFSAGSTNGFDASAFSKAMQDGMKQAFGNGGSNMFSGGGSWDPGKMLRQMNDRALENVRVGLGFADETEWSAVRPLVEQVIELQQKNEQAAQQLRTRRFFGNNNPFMKNFPAAFKAQQSPEQAALQQAVDDNATAAQVREAIAKFRTAQKEQQVQLEAAQASLRKVLTTRQEAQAILLGLLN
jgi:nucleoid-associated protein YgaU